jgi:lipid A ethanolaminephosphotransferase
MALRLFHITEFAQSMLSPAAQREARHPAQVVVLAAVWLAAVGNVPLWRALATLPQGSLVLLGAAVAVGVVLAGLLSALLALLNWPGLLRPLITALLAVTAYNTLALLAGQGALHASTALAQGLALPTLLHRLGNWSNLLWALGAVALAPMAWLWSRQLRRIPLWQRLVQNLLLAAAALAVAASAWWLGRTSLLPLLQEQPRWLGLISPLNTLLSFQR